MRPQRPAHTGISAPAAVILGVVVLLVCAVALLNLVNVPKVIFRPGPVYDTLGEVDGASVISVDGAQTYPTSGSLDFTTITVTGGPQFPVSAWDWIVAQVDPSTAVTDEEDVFPDNATPAQVREQNIELMQNSQEEAAVVALRATGEDVPEQVKVAQVLVGAPADGVLRADDEILEVDGTPISNAEEVREALQDFDPGTEVDLLVGRDGEERTIAVPTEEGEVPEGEDSGPTIVGVFLRPDFVLPFEVTIDAGNVGGPSAGLMFSLALYDTLTPGPLTGGADIAGTGTITSTGDVGGIGGIRQKMLGAQQSGADYFLAPAANCGEVVGHVPDGLTVTSVETFEQARTSVEAIAEGADDALPTCPIG